MAGISGRAKSPGTDASIYFLQAFHLVLGGSLLDFASLKVFSSLLMTQIDIRQKSLIKYSVLRNRSAQLKK
jgi:hypothetical protein